MKLNLIVIFVASFLFTACSDKKEHKVDTHISKKHSPFVLPDISITQPETNRWYTGKQILKGQKTFNQICAGCHKKDASGTKNWDQANSAGAYPPPPLNGNAHTWHHPLNQIHSTIKDGTASLGGNMPAWGKVLSDEKILETIAFFQSKWSDEIYAQWANKGDMHH